MNIVQMALFGLVGLYILGIAIAFISERSASTITMRELTSIEEEYQQTSYKFNDPDLAYEVLTQLEVSSDPIINSGFQSKPKDSKPYLNLKTDDGYCDKRRAYFAQFPESVFEEMDFITDVVPKSLVRNKVLMQLGHDIQPYIGLHMNKNEQTLYEIKPTVANFFTRTVLFADKKIGEHFSCVSQISNHIPGKQALAMKDSFTEAAMKYSERFTERPQCFDLERFFPKTFLLYQKESCQDFFKVFNSQEYQTMKEQHKIVYMKKIGRGAHTGTGVDPVNDQEEAELRKVYNNGKNCGKVESKVLIQNYIHNPLLLDGHKFDFNMFLLVASINPLMAFYHDGFLRVSMTEYDVNSGDRKAFLSNLFQKESAGDNRDSNEGMTEEDIRHAQQWTLERFFSHLLQRGIVRDPNWLDNYLRPAFKKAMIHLLRFALVSFSENSSVYQLYGVDFMIDTDLNLWFLEVNSAPGLDGFAQPVEKMVVKMLNDELEIVMGLLRSRMKRVINYVNEIISNGSVGENEEGKITIKNFETTKVRFGKLNENYFEREFEPSAENGFSKIIDENYLGTQKYIGFVTQECL